MTQATLTIPLPRRGVVQNVLGEYGAYVAIAALLLYNLVFTANFFTAGNFRTQLIQMAPVLIVSLGMALTIGTGGIDVSVGAVMALAAAVVPLYIGYGVFPTVLIAIAGGLLIGLINGVMIGYIGVQPLVATLSFMVAGRGIALLIANEQLRSVSDPGILAIGRGSLLAGTPFAVPYAVIIAGGALIMIAVLINKTTFGKQLLAIGGNRRASELAGMPVKRRFVAIYMICAGLAAVAGVIVCGRLGASVPSTTGNLMELSAITAVVVGGTPMTGGRIKVVGTVAGALLMQLLTATLIKHNVPDAYSQITQAVIVLLAVYIQRGRSTGK